MIGAVLTAAFPGLVGLVALITREVMWTRKLRRMAYEMEELKPRAVPVFRRPVGLGDLHLPWDEVERIRVAILATQLAHDEDGAVRWTTFGGGRFGLVTGPGVADEDIPEGADPELERVLYWLGHWQDHVLALTGRAK